LSSVVDDGGLEDLELIELFRAMCLARAAEERLELLQKQGLITGGLYLSLGQEAGGVGVAYPLRRRRDAAGDVMAQSLRGSGALLLFGASLQDFFRQYTGRATGPTGGREGGVGWGSRELGILGPIAPLGTMLEVMAGITLAFRLRGEDRVGVVFTGDGATSTGAWHEGLVFAAAQRCPMVLVIENNQWAFSTPTDRNTRLDSFTEKAGAYGVSAESVDGTDVVAVAKATAEAAHRARYGAGVQILELRYFRRRGHAQHDAQEYVDPEALREWEQKDPLSRHQRFLVESGRATVDELYMVWNDVVRQCAEVAEAITAEPEPDGPEALAPVLTDRVVPAPCTRSSLPDPRHA
jgi:pyruvate dehydrogenase E1 component alpha subunit/2-oxoisovalerate dehydrogenase E1 component alpha subunit